MRMNICSGHPATTWSCTLSLHDALPILSSSRMSLRMTLNTVSGATSDVEVWLNGHLLQRFRGSKEPFHGQRSEEHTSELQSRLHLVCGLLLDKDNALARAFGDPVHELAF